MSTSKAFGPQSAGDDLPAGPMVLRVRAKVQHYKWGSTDFIPALLGEANPGQVPFAELWMGAHPDLPATVEIHSGELPLDTLIEQSAPQLLGPQVAERFDGKLPYLFKVLSASVPLSIQVHPTRQQAREGYARENQADISVTDPRRNYKDDNHKPEILAALTDFYALRGFRPLAEISRLLADVPELQGMMPDYQPTPEGLKNLYERLMTMDQEEVDAILSPLVMRLTAADRETPFDRSDREFWVLRADQFFSRGGRRDRGVFSIFLLNLVHLQPGQAVYLSAGVLHAYLEGSGMELMANSNNVLRGGLTSKHVDESELLANVIFEGGPAEVLEPVSMPGAIEWAYRTPAAEFELRRIDVSFGRPFRSGQEHSADMLILTGMDDSAEVSVASAGREWQLRRGSVFFAPCGVDFSVQASSPATLYRATVPDVQGDGSH